MGTKREKLLPFSANVPPCITCGDRWQDFILNQFFFSIHCRLYNCLLLLCVSVCSFRFETWWMTCCCCCCGCGFRSKNKNKLWKLTLGPWLLTSPSIPVSDGSDLPITRSPICRFWETPLSMSNKLNKVFLQIFSSKTLMEKK